MSPSYISGLHHAYQYFKSIDKELDFNDLINFKLPNQDFFLNIPTVAQNGLIKILQNEKLNAVYDGLNAEPKQQYGKGKELDYIFTCAKILGNKTPAQLENVKDRLEHSLWDGGFLYEFEETFEKNLIDNWYALDSATATFANNLFKVIKENVFTTSIENEEFDINDGFRGNEYIKVLQRMKKYKN